MALVLPGPVGVACLVSKKFAEESTGGCHAEGFSALHPYYLTTPKNYPLFPDWCCTLGTGSPSSKGFKAVIFRHHS